MRIFLLILAAVVAINVYLTVKPTPEWLNPVKESCRDCIAKLPEKAPPTKKPQEVSRKYSVKKAKPVDKPKAPVKLTQRLSVAVDRLPERIHPHSVHGDAERSLLLALFDGLTRRNLAGEVEASLAETLEASEDSLTFVIRLREAQWSDGNAVTAYDFLYAWKQLLLSGRPQSENLLVLKNARAIQDKTLPEEELGVYVSSDHVFVIALEEPTPHFPELLAEPSFYPVPMVLDQSNPEWANELQGLVGNGPFVVNKVSPEVLEVSRSTTYWDRIDPHLESLSFVLTDEALAGAFFFGGELHWLGAPFFTVTNSAGLKLEGHPTHRTEFLLLDTQSFPLSNRKFRQALAQVIDRSSMTQEGHLAAKRLLPPKLAVGHRAYFGEKTVGDAQELLEQAIDEMGIARNDLPTLKMSHPDPRVAALLQEQWKTHLGIEVELTANASEAQIRPHSFVSEATDPLALLAGLEQEEATRWSSFMYQELVDKVRRVEEPLERNDLIAEAERVFLEEMPAIPVSHKELRFTKSPLLRDVVLTPGGCCDFKWARLKRLPKD